MEEKVNKLIDDLENVKDILRAELEYSELIDRLHTILYGGVKDGKAILGLDNNRLISKEFKAALKKEIERFNPVRETIRKYILFENLLNK